MLDLTHVFNKLAVLETERLTLRAAKLTDAPELFRLLSDPQVVRYMGQPTLTAMEEAVERVYMYHALFDGQDSIPWVIALRETDQVIGTFTFWNLLLQHYRSEIGYSLHPDWWGKGVMTEAAAAVLTYGFETMGLHSVEARTDPENAASRRLLEKLGFVLEAHFHEDFYDPVTDKFLDTTVYSLIKSAWMSRVNG